MKNSKPPRWPTKLLKRFCAPHLLEEVMGDLHERYQLRVQRMGEAKAKRQYWREVLAYVRPSILKRQYNTKSISMDMFKNYFKIAFRNLRAKKFYAGINILGLAIGMACCILIFLYVSHELSYGKFHTKADRIYRILTDIKTPTETLNIGVTSAPMAPSMRADFPEVEDMVRLDDAQLLIQRGEQTFQEDESMFADSSFFKVFSFKLLRGNPNTALVKPFSIVLTEDAARKYFGDEDPMGQRLQMDGEHDLTVTGVMQNVPENSNFTFDVLLSLSTTMEKLDTNRARQWGNFGFQSYVLLAEHADPLVLQSKLPGFLEKYISNQDRSEGMNYFLSLEPLSDVYFSGRDSPKAGSLTNIKIFSVIAAFILLIAGINFMNLATARATERAKEVGIRKVVGALRRQLTVQFLCEAILLSMLAFIIAVLGSELLLPAFNQLAGKTVSVSIFQDAYHLPLFLGVAFGIGLLAGIYPALVLSRFKSVAILKGRFSSSQRGVWLRKGLVVVQFTISIILMTGTAVVYTQLHFMRNQTLGFKKDQMLIIDFRGDDAIQKKIETFKQQLGNVSGISSAAASSSVPTRNSHGAYSEIENPAGDMQASNINLFYVDHDFLHQYEMQLAAGRIFSPDFATDTSALIANEALVKSYGYQSPEEIIGKKFSQWGVEGEIIGVIKDYHYRSLQKEVAPITIRLEPDNARYISLNLKGKNITSTVAALEQQWKAIAPQRPFNYFFLDEAFDQQYRGEMRFGQLFVCFAGLAIFIACLGLLGLISYTVVQRTKEIGIRKVLGASAQSIVTLLTKDFLSLVALAFLIATPVAWYVMHQWLQDFANRIDIEWWVFALAGIMALMIAMLTVGFQSIKAAFANPVDTLRSE